jgi:hypothetical protein
MNVRVNVRRIGYYNITPVVMRAPIRASRQQWGQWCQWASCTASWHSTSRCKLRPKLSLSHSPGLRNALNIAILSAIQW